LAEPLLSIQNLGVDFVVEKSVTPALNNISFSVQKGEIVAIVGESGSGKSITALSVLQLLATPPAKYKTGKIIFDDETGNSRINILQQPASYVRKIRGNKISMIFQEPMTSLNPLLSCGIQTMESIILHQKLSPEKAKEKVIDLFRQVQLPQPEQLFNRFPHEISGGQKQRVMIAIAISCDPALLIADEPTTALDVTVQQSILTLIKELRIHKALAVIFITHDLGLVAQIANRVIVMYKGNIVEQADTTTIFTHPQHPYTKALLNCRPALHSGRERLPVVSDFMETTSDGIIIEKKRVENLPPKQSAFITGEQSAAQQGAPLLEARNICVWFPKRKGLFTKAQEYTKAVNNVSFYIDSGETVGLVGESGCGKTTLGRSLLKLIEPTSGEVLFEGQNLLRLSPEAMRKKRRSIQIIFQDPYSSLNPRITVGAAISEAMSVHNIGKNDAERREMIMEILKKVGLNPGHYYNYPHEFSGGQRQRIGIARTLVLNPSFIICDESVSALDVSVQAQVLNLLNDLKKEYGFSMLFISHDLSVVRYISDRIMVMYKGEIVESGSTEQVYNHPQQQYTQQLITASSW
jgi:peptide/nickel transport system ATP-binding protein